MPENRKAASGTQEWAAINVNIQNGCHHDCHYCYAKSMAIRFKRTTPESWSEPELRQQAVAKRYTKRNGRIMFPTAHDITEDNIEPCLKVLKRMLAVGNKVLIVSKPRPTCVRQMCLELASYRSDIVFRFSIGSKSNSILRKWEPGAPTFSDRKKALKFAHDKGFATSVSCEPMLDDNVAAVIKDVRPYVTDSIWLGKANRLRSIVPVNSPKNTRIREEAEHLIAMQSDKAIKALYRRFKTDPMIKWKDSIKKVVGLRRPTEKGMDI
jgi:DNA repair photolyase